ncbi:hypothetical protein BU198_13070, partial [Streptomyces sp. CBMA156]|nr:hypothetical protein [Streptomyces sp. CBMA156]
MRPRGTPRDGARQARPRSRDTGRFPVHRERTRDRAATPSRRAPRHGGTEDTTQHRPPTRAHHPAAVRHTPGPPDAAP